MNRNTAAQAVVRVRQALIPLAFALVVLAATASAAAAASPDIRLYTEAPDTAAAGSTVDMSVAVRNVGDAPAVGEITVTHVASDALTFQGLSSTPAISSVTTGKGTLSGVDCSTVGQTTTCRSTVELPAGVQYYYRARWAVDPGASGSIDYHVEVEGAGVVRAEPVDREIAVGGPPPFGFADAMALFTAPDGSVTRQAGSSPWETVTELRFATYAALWLNLLPIQVQPEHPRDIVVRAPAGLVANSQATARCSAVDLVAKHPVYGEVPSCSADSAVGLFTGIIGGATNVAPLYNVEPPPGFAAAFGAFLYGVPIVLAARLRDSDYGADIVSLNTSTTVPLTNAHVTIWGNPGDKRHDAVRANCLASGGHLGGLGLTCPRDASEQAFMRLPTSCSGEPLNFESSADSYENPGVFSERTFAAPPLEGCEDVPFDPALAVSPSSGRAGGPTGLDVVLSVPQHTSPNGLAQADLRKAVVRLPEGMTINPSSAHGLRACTDAQLRKGLRGPSQCPNGSKIGSVSVKSPLLDHVLEGSVHVLSQKSSDPGSGAMFRIAITVDSAQDGIHLKLPGAVAADPETGRLTTTFDNNPQLPFSEFRLRFKSGQRAPLVNPRSCGEHQVDVELTGWNGAVQTPPSSFEVDEGCEAQGFDPSFDAGSVSPVAGGFSPFVTRITRPDGDRELRRIDVDLPQGVLADLSGVELCSNAQVAAASGRDGRAAIGQPVCPAGSQIGTTTVGAGAGSDPFYPLLSGGASGRVFLTEPYTASKFGPAEAGPPAYGLAIEVPAVAGPYDLGDVVVRAGLFVDPETAEVTIASDPLPLVVKGVRLFTQDVRVDIDREDFTVNPTSCEETAVKAAIFDPAGNAVERSSRFQVGDCARLGLSPRLSMRLRGRKQMRSGGNPAVRVKLSMPSGDQANLEKVRAALPKNLILDPEAAVRKSLLCPYEKAQVADCPASSEIGTASAVSPLLKRPLKGKVYFVQGKRRHPRTGNLIRALPQLLLKLRGEVALNVRATSDVKGGRLISTFPVVPDAPVSSFTLNLKGGKQRGILSVAQTRDRKLSLCERPQNALLSYRAHNDRTANRIIRLKTPCAGNGVEKRLKLRRSS